MRTYTTPRKTDGSFRLGVTISRVWPIKGGSGQISPMDRQMRHPVDSLTYRDFQSKAMARLWGCSPSFLAADGSRLPLSFSEIEIFFYS